MIDGDGDGVDMSYGNVTESRAVHCTMVSMSDFLIKPFQRFPVTMAVPMPLPQVQFVTNNED